MILTLRLLFIGVLLAMISVTSWASLHCPLFGVPREVATHPWFIATLFDAYFGFLTFYVWVAYRESHWVSKVSWFIGIMLLGNLAMASYCLSVLWAPTGGKKITELVLEKQTKLSLLGITFSLLGAAVLFLA